MRKLAKGKVLEYSPCKRTIAYIQLLSDAPFDMSCHKWTEKEFVQFPYILFWLEYEILQVAYCTQRYKKGVKLYYPRLPNMDDYGYDICLGGHDGESLEEQIAAFWQTAFVRPIWHNNHKNIKSLSDCIRGYATEGEVPTLLRPKRKTKKKIRKGTVRRSRCKHE